MARRAVHRFGIFDASPASNAPSGRPPTYTAITRFCHSVSPVACDACGPEVILASTSSGVRRFRA